MNRGRASRSVLQPWWLLVPAMSAVYSNSHIHRSAPGMPVVAIRSRGRPQRAAATAPLLLPQCISGVHFFLGILFFLDILNVLGIRLEVHEADKAANFRLPEEFSQLRVLRDLETDNTGNAVA